jgi:pilus assembly protein Flp/PilA
MRRLVQRLFKDRSGATAIEYGLIGALISIAIIVGATTLGTTLRDVYTGVASALTVGTAAQ